MEDTEQTESATEAEERGAEETKAEAAANAESQPEGDGKANETAAGQEEGGSPAPEESEEERKSRSQRQRERKKAYIAELEAKLRDAESALDARRKADAGRAEPKEADYDDPTEYAVARALWRQSQTEATSQQKAAEEGVRVAQEARQREVVAAWNERVAEARGRYQDFDAVAMSPAVAITPAMGEVIMTSDAGPDIAYHLGSNPAVAAQIAALPPAQAAYELGRVEARLTTPKPRTQTAAPAPIKPVVGRSSGEKSPEKMTPAEYRAWREKGGTL